MSFPARNTITGKLLNDYLQQQQRDELEDHAIHLIFAANRWELMDTMRRALMSGTTLIVDRYSYSGIAYSAAKDNMEPEWCKHAEAGLLKPDMVIYLDIGEQEAVKRHRPCEEDERYETTKFQEYVAKNYEWVLFGGGGGSVNCVRVDATRDVDSIHKQLEVIVQETVCAVKDSILEEIHWNCA
jgi:dTMP kinase